MEMGAIGREELGALDEEMDNSSIDCFVMSLVDTSGDGQLFKEFLQWVVADELGAREGRGVPNDAARSFIISSCSRSEMNAEHVQLDQFYGRRPVLLRPENERCLFYQKAYQSWLIC